MRFKKKEHKPPWEKILKDLGEMEEGLSEQEWSKRTLCVDENCIGVVGKDGFCGVCGRDVSKGPAEEEGLDEPPFEANVAAEASTEPSLEEDVVEVQGDLSERILCSDEACIGLVGTDGYCKICDLRWKPSGYADDEAWVYREDA